MVAWLHCGQQRRKCDGFSVVILSAPELQKGESYILDIGGNSGTYTAK